MIFINGEPVINGELLLKSLKAVLISAPFCKAVLTPAKLCCKIAEKIF